MLMTSELNTDLQKLLQKRLDELTEKHKSILAQREQLEAQSKQLQTDIAALHEALNVEARATGQAIPKTTSNGSRLLGLKLGEAIRILREENPRINKNAIRSRLQEAGFDFKGKRPGSAVHMAWTQLERQKHKSGDT